MEKDTAVVEVMATIEEKLKELYLLFSRRFIDDYNFWKILADAERSHAAILRSFAELVGEQSGEKVEWKFNTENLQKTIVFLDAMLEREFTDADAAIELAEELEKNLIEKENMSAFKNEMPEINQLFNLLDQESARHLEMISVYKVKRKKSKTI